MDLSLTDAAHLHIVLVHLPVVGFPLLFLLLLSGLLRKSREIIGAALSGTVIIAALTIPPYLLGKSAEELIEKQPQISEEAIESHEEAAGTAFVVAPLN